MTIPTFDLTELCFVCDRPIGEGDEPGATQMDNGTWVPNCSEACAEAFYAESED